MAEITEKMTSWWESRAPQERKTLKIAVPIILLMLLYILLVEPIMSLYFARKNDYQEAQDTLTWMYDQTALVSRMQNSCGSRIFYLQPGESPETLAQNIARRSSINATYRMDGESVSVAIASTPGSRLLAYVQSLTCNGFQIKGLEVERVDAAGAAVKAAFSAVPVSLPRPSP